MDLIIEFLQGREPEDENEVEKLRRQTAHYLLQNGALYKRGVSLPLLKCLAPDETEYALREVHEGICGDHIEA